MCGSRCTPHGCASRSRVCNRGPSALQGLGQCVHVSRFPVNTMLRPHLTSQGPVFGHPFMTSTPCRPPFPCSGNSSSLPPSPRSTLTANWGYILNATTTTTTGGPSAASSSIVAPIWLGEFGTGNTSEPWWQYVKRYIGEQDLGWAYWAVNGLKNFPSFGAGEPYGIFKPDFKQVSRMQVARLPPYAGAPSPLPPNPGLNPAQVRGQPRLPCLNYPPVTSPR